MTSREERFLSLYRAYRHDDQYNFYESRRVEFESAHEQAIDLSAWLMAGSTLVAALAAADVAGLRPVWAMLGVALPTLSSALTAYDRLYAFDQQAKLYRDAAHALQLARADLPDRRQTPDDTAYARGLGAYVTEVEGVFGREQGQWGQLISELQQVEPDSALPRSAPDQGVGSGNVPP
ncbi:MAG TPA: SLATT domain-containing protein [Chloroflexota bacterium]